MTKDKLIIEEAKKHYSEDIKCYDAFLHGVEFAEKLSPWISVEDDLPCNHEELLHPQDKRDTLEVFCFFNGAIYITDMYKYDGKWHWREFFSQQLVIYSPTHWMPIPKPPKD